MEGTRPNISQHPAHHERPAALGYARLLRLPRHCHACLGRPGRRWRAVRALLRERHHLHAEPCLHADRQAAAGARRVPAARHAARRPGAAAGASEGARLPDRAGRQAACVGARGGSGAAPSARRLRPLRVVHRSADPSRLAVQRLRRLAARAPPRVSAPPPIRPAGPPSRRGAFQHLGRRARHRLPRRARPGAGRSSST